MHTQGRYSLLTDEFTHVESDNKNIQCTLEADTAHSQMGPLMPRVQQDHTMHTRSKWHYTIKLMAYTTHLKVGSQKVNCAKIQQLKTDTINQVGSEFYHIDGRQPWTTRQNRQ